MTETMPGISSKSKAARRARDELIREEMRFVLQRDKRRFARQLRARLLEEGCNLPLRIARPLFYEAMITALTPRLDPAARQWLHGRLSGDCFQISHERFHEAVRYLENRLAGAAQHMAGAAIEAVAVLKARWQIDADVFCRDPRTFDTRLQEAADLMAKANPAGLLAARPPAALRHRVQLALTVTLLRYVAQPAEFEAAFGVLDRCLTELAHDQALFCRLMAFFFSRISHASHLASQTFWRALQTLDTEAPAATDG